ncbi:pyridoxal phosphate-dependent aminotransferase [Francisella philomiragia]|uniref:pyridoxal phosphate-dependent aminotransferase n=1 Tax=Francisella philomiragia TaxID=28110 RepID=UPI0019057145|nr:pyridoxal phosphate-dependent aminotransferase [Francisella philomiragia]MBK2255931.1 pyridoxal phosphate-dependent aminotransferase [Francisella philomiragia]MBK2268589.1 pyridoxal phosphate-dependent aminotransferase [Francisella philomiragia]MBK2270936.1 pyridoxal phosphate-dependent aminotransferase [Francisella philomiragia]MBK2274716.1 pyridoxal phosphate-dependent aminotransferase [Francisella philomiragia]MBK2294310.1 pyridoxal phosphate-dependent aminotransferase [Francisella philo
MASLNTKIQNVSTSPTNAMAALAKQIKDQGHDVISLAIGEPGFSSPDIIKQAGIEAINNNITKYTNVDGLKELREAVSARYKREYGVDFAADQICITSGAKHSLHNIFNCILEEGDEAIFFAPYWVSYPDMIALTGAKPVVVKTKFENSFEIDVTDLEKHITEKTKAVIINSPNNPTGLIYSRKCIEDLANLLRKYPNIWIIGDDIYDQLYFNNRITLITEVAPDLADRYVIASGVSKNFAMTGWRVGFTIAPKLLNDAMKKFQSQSATCACSISQYAAITAMQMPSQDLQYFVDSYKQKEQFVTKCLKDMPYIDVKSADGTFYLFPDIRDLIKHTSFSSDIELCNALLEEEYVAMMPGTAFGLSGFARISCANEMPELEEAMSRLSRFVKRHVSK